VSVPTSAARESQTVCQLTGQWRDRQYLLHVPGPGAPVTQPRPLVVQLHGRGIDALRFDWWTGLSGLADAAGFVLAIPRAVGEIWNDGRYAGRTQEIDDVSFLAAVIEDAAGRTPIDRARVYLVGMSNGSTMAGRFACERPELIAGMGQVAGTAGVAFALAGPAMPVPVINLHGSADRSAPYAGGQAGGLGRMLMMRNRAGPAIGVDEWAEFWRSVNGDEAIPSVEPLAADISVRRWRGPNPSGDLDFYRIEGGGHTWPGSSARVWIPPIFGKVAAIDASRLIWDFLSAHRRG
jgi:polyhydroxybutyrate depolymerase